MKTLREKLIEKGWVTEYNADTLVSLIEKHYNGSDSQPTTLDLAMAGDRKAARKVLTEMGLLESVSEDKGD